MEQGIDDDILALVWTLRAYSLALFFEYGCCRADTHTGSERVDHSTLSHDASRPYDMGYRPFCACCSLETE